MIFARTVFAAGLVAVVPALPAIADDRVSIDEETHYWTVYGNGIDAIGIDLQDPPPELHGYQGYATFTYDWTFDTKMMRRSDGTRVCKPVNVHVSVELDTWLPEHSYRDRLKAPVRRAWDRFSQALAQHEANHIEDFRRTGLLIPDALEAVEAPTCAEVRTRVDEVGQDYGDRAQQLADAYDERTDHGLSEGTQFPPP